MTIHRVCAVCHRTPAERTPYGAYLCQRHVAVVAIGLAVLLYRDYLYAVLLSGQDPPPRIIPGDQAMRAANAMWN